MNSKTPWACQKSTIYRLDNLGWVATTNRAIGGQPEDQELENDNARTIVVAVNHHDKLVEIATEVLAMADACCESANMSKALDAKINPMALMKFRAVLESINKAKGE